MKSTRSVRSLSRFIALAGGTACVAALGLAAACSSDDSTSGTPAPTTGDSSTTPGADTSIPPSTLDSSMSTDSPIAVVDAGVSVKVKRTDLVVDQADSGLAGAIVDPNLVNPWGLAIGPTGVAWISDNHSSNATLYSATGAVQALVVAVPGPGGVGMGAPTGQVFNATAADFSGDKFIIATEDGTIAGWQAGATAVIRADKSATSAVYKGFDILNTGTARIIVAANFNAGTVDVFDATYASITLAGGFTDPSPMVGFAPFNVLASGTNVLVAYAKQDADKMDDVAGVGNGYINVFDKTGTFVRRLVTGGSLNSPWAMAMVPNGFSTIGGDLMVGNFGDGRINVFDATTGASIGRLTDATGTTALQIEGLWALTFGADLPGEAHTQIFFTAGPGAESHGIFGRIDLAP
jgi:uncharacterized protein (TIGR03118 family)